MCVAPVFHDGRGLEASRGSRLLKTDIDPYAALSEESSLGSVSPGAYHESTSGSVRNSRFHELYRSLVHARRQTKKQSGMDTRSD